MQAVHSFPNSHRATTLPGIRLRASQHEGDASDLEFLYSVYASSRADEMAQVLDWTDEQKEAFLRSQFSLQHEHYHSHFPAARYDVICEGKRPIGRLYVDRGETDMRVMDIALLPESRGRGIGRALIKEVLVEAESAGLPVGLHVEATNPAKRLYEQLGFRVVEDVGVYERMERLPSDRCASPG